MSLLRARVDGADLRGLAAGTTYVLEGPEALRLARVARARPGEILELFDGNGGCWRARVVQVGRDRLHCLVERPGRAADPLLPVILLQAAAKGGRMEMALEKATELGVGAIWVVLTRWCVARPDPDTNRLARWRRVVESAARQCGRASVPEVLGPLPWLQAVQRLEGLASGWVKLVAWEGASEPLTRLLQALPPSPAGVAVTVGPEGGLTAEEVELAVRAGARAAHLGPRILRTETAAAAVLALVHGYAGDLAPQASRPGVCGSGAF